MELGSKPLMVPSTGYILSAQVSGASAPARQQASAIFSYLGSAGLELSSKGASLLLRR